MRNKSVNAEVVRPDFEHEIWTVEQARESGWFKPRLKRVRFTGAGGSQPVYFDTGSFILGLSGFATNDAGASGNRLWEFRVSHPTREYIIDEFTIAAALFGEQRAQVYRFTDDIRIKGGNNIIAEVNNLVAGTNLLQCDLVFHCLICIG